MIKEVAQKEQEKLNEIQQIFSRESYFSRKTEITITLNTKKDKISLLIAMAPINSETKTARFSSIRILIRKATTEKSQD